MSGRQSEIVIDPAMESPGELLEAEGVTGTVAATDWRAADGKDPNDSRPGNKHDPGQKYFHRHRQAMDDHLERFSNELEFVHPKHTGIFWTRHKEGCGSSFLAVQLCHGAFIRAHFG